MSKNSIIISLLLLLSIHVNGQNGVATFEEEVHIETNHGKLHGSLLTPKTDIVSPIVLIIAGSGPTDRNGNNSMMENNSLKMFAEMLAKHNIESLRYDKLGIGASQSAMLVEDSLKFNILVEDALSWLQYLKDKGYNDIYIAGHSQGSLVGMLAAQEFSINGFISLAGAGYPMDRLIKKQVESQPPMIRDSIISALNKLKQGKFIEDVDPILYTLLRPSIQPFLMSYMQFHPAEEITKIDIPILIVQGTTDIQISVEEARLLHSKAPKSSLEIIEGMNHIFKSSDIDRAKNITTYNNPTLPIMKELEKVVIEFIKK